MTKVTNGEETLTVLGAWKKDGVFKVRGALSDFSSRLHFMWLQNPKVPKSIYFASVIQVESTRVALWLQVISVLQQVSGVTNETPSVTLQLYRRTLGGHRDHGFETDIVDLALEALMASKLAALIKAKAVNGGTCSHEDEVRTARDVSEVAQPNVCRVVFSS